MTGKKTFHLLLLIGIILLVVVFLISYLNIIFIAPFSLTGIFHHSLTREALDQSLDLGTKFMLNNQTLRGNFNYEYDWKKKIQSTGDNQVRQAGALWGLSLIFHDTPEKHIGDAIEKSLHFFHSNSVRTDDGLRYIVYPGTGKGSMGTVALMALAHIEYLRGAETLLSEEKYASYKMRLNEYINFLLHGMNKTQLWHASYNYTSGRAFGRHSPYFDGESWIEQI